MISEATILEQLEAADAKYRTPGGTIQDDQDTRELLDGVTFDSLEEDTWTADINSSTVALPRVNAKVYSGGNAVIDPSPTYFSGVVADALQAGDVFDTGATTSDDYTAASPYVDSLTLIEASKQTGELYF